MVSGATPPQTRLEPVARRLLHLLLAAALLSVLSAFAPSLGAAPQSSGGRGLARAAAPSVAKCPVARDARIYVGLGPSASLTNFERAAKESRKVLRVVTAALCSASAAARNPEASADGPTGARLTAPLWAALRASRRVVLEQVLFDDQSWTRAHVVLRTERAKPRVVARFHAQLRSDAAGWHLERAIDPPLE